MHSESKKADFITYRSLNWSIQRISEKIGVCPRTLADWNGQYKDAIANLRYLHADVHFQNLVEARQKDLQTLSRRQQVLDNELAQRDLSDIPTDKLMRLAILSREEFLEASTTPGHWPRTKATFRTPFHGTFGTGLAAPRKPKARHRKRLNRRTLKKMLNPRPRPPTLSPELWRQLQISRAGLAEILQFLCKNPAETLQ